MDNQKIFPKKWILIRGLTRSSFHWFDFKDQLMGEFKLGFVETPELPGNGYLSELNTPKNLSECVIELKKQILNSAEPVGLIGISLGGIIATKWALEYPDEISHLVLINSSFSFSPFYQRLYVNNYLNILRTAISNSSKKIEKFILNVTSNNENKNKVLTACIDFQKKHPIKFKNLIQQLLLARNSHFTKKPKADVLILTSKNDRLVNFQCSQKIAETWMCPIEIHPTAGHDLPLDDSDWIIEKIKAIFKN